MLEFIKTEDYKTFKGIIGKLPFDDMVWVTDYLLAQVREKIELEEKYGTDKSS